MKRRSKKIQPGESQIARKYSSKNPLSNILVCKECGSSFRRVLRNRKGVRMPCWVCATHAETGKNKYNNTRVYTESEIYELTGVSGQIDIVIQSEITI